MKTIKILIPLAFFAAAILPAQAAVTVFTDNFDYSGWDSGDNPANAVWSPSAASGSTGTLILNGTDSRFSGGWRISTPNNQNGGVVRADFSQAATTDFTLTMQILPREYQRALWVGIFNADGTQGYGFRWDTGATGTPAGTGQGQLTLRAFSSATANPDYHYSNDIGTQLGSSVNSGYALGSPAPGTLSEPINVRFSWSQETRTLTLSLLNPATDSDYVIKSTYTFAEGTEIIDSFSRIYIGSGASYALLFDSILVTTSNIPEPAAAATLVALITLAGLAITRRRR